MASPPVSPSPQMLVISCHSWQQSSHFSSPGSEETNPTLLKLLGAPWRRAR